MDAQGKLDERLLSLVVTVPEVMELYNKSQMAVMMAIWRGQIVARQSGEHAPWLVSLPSVERIWGKAGVDNE